MNATLWLHHFEKPGKIKNEPARALSARRGLAIARIVKDLCQTSMMMR
jgi:hypothetical protein